MTRDANGSTAVRHGKFIAVASMEGGVGKTTRVCLAETLAADDLDAVPAVRANAAEFARKAMLKQLKDKAVTVELLRRICAASGEEVVSAILDEWTPAEVTALVKKVDARSADAEAGGDKAGADAAGPRRHMIDLADGRAKASEAVPTVEKPAKTKKAPASPRSKIGSVLQSKVHSGAKRPARSKKDAWRLLLRRASYVVLRRLVHSRIAKPTRPKTRPTAN